MQRATGDAGPGKDITFNTSQRFFGSVFGSPTFDMDMDGNMLTIPGILESITGFSHEDLDRFSIKCLILNEDRQKVATAIESIKDGAPVVICEADILSEKEGSHSVELVFAPKFTGGEMSGICGAVKDISSRSSLERELKRARDVQTASQKFLSDFVPLMTREIRQPLTTILLTLEMLDSGFFGDLSLSQRDKVVQLIEQVDRVKGILNDALSASREIDMNISLERSPIPLLETVEGVISSGGGPIEERSIKVSFNYPLEDIRVEADRKTLAQVVSTLLENSINASPVSGQIRIEISEHGENAMFSISDSGNGMPEEDIPKLFENVMNDRTRGSTHLADALSLYIAKRMIEGQGGRLWCESFPGIGSTYIFTLKKAVPVAECR